MRWTLLALCASLAGCGAVAREPAQAPTLRMETPPKQVELGWQERYGEGERHLRFEVASFDVTNVGWTARIAIENRTGGVFELGARPLALTFGLMLFADGRLDTLDELNAAGALPAIRRATEIEPAPPEALAPAERWEATIGARGSLPQGAWVRVCFGTLFAVGEPPPGLEPRVVWITDRAHRL
jgi:hypothetical protein